jgi:spore germination protein GerM
MTTTANRAIAALAAAVVLLSGCGVTTEDSPRAIDSTPHSVLPSPTPAVAETGPATQKLFLVHNGQLVAVTRRIPTEPSPQTLIDDLLAGPTTTESANDLTSALLGFTQKPAVTVTAGAATVELGADTVDSARNDDVLAYAQIVCTLTERADIHTVAFTRDGRPWGVPRGDGSLTPAPVTCSDYVNLRSAE